MLVAASIRRTLRVITKCDNSQGSGKTSRPARLDLEAHARPAACVDVHRLQGLPTVVQHDAHAVPSGAQHLVRVAACPRSGRRCTPSRARARPRRAASRGRGVRSTGPTTTTCSLGARTATTARGGAADAQAGPRSPRPPPRAPPIPERFACRPPRGPDCGPLVRLDPGGARRVERGRARLRA